jgi:hypothetical protein
MIIAEIQHPAHPRLPTRLRPRHQPPALIQRRQTLIWWAKRPRPTTHTRHQQTPDPIINNTDGQCPANDITGTAAATNTADPHTGVDDSITAYFDGIVTLGFAVDATAGNDTAGIPALGAGIPHTGVDDSITAHFDIAVPRAIVTSHSITAQIRPIGASIACLV